ncbi:MAG: hypothetical protein OIF32_00375, partial [Campylobacterales bacterium]|nr:hypothetical protein [Campylobacterales bacterium]
PIFFLSLTLSLLGTEKQEIEKIIEKINQNNQSSYEKTKNPFISRKESNSQKLSTPLTNKKKKSIKKISLQAIISDRVLIWGKWYKEGHYIQGKKIVYIGDKGIILSKKNGHREIIKLVNKNKNGFILKKVR